jgi:hypothetical protein
MKIFTLMKERRNIPFWRQFYLLINKIPIHFPVEMITVYVDVLVSLSFPPFTLNKQNIFSRPKGTVSIEM